MAIAAPGYGGHISVEAARFKPAVRTAVLHPALAGADEGQIGFTIAPALYVACCFGAGVLGAARWWFAPAWLLCAVAGLALLTGLSAVRAIRVALLPLGLLFLLLGILGAELQPPVDPERALAVQADGTERSINGEVLRVEPIRRTSYTAFFGHKTHDEQAQRVDLRVLRIDGRLAAGGLRLTVYSPLDKPLPTLRCGTQLRVPVAMHTEQRYLDPGVWDTSAYLHQQGIGALGSAAAEKVDMEGAARPSFGCWLHTLQTRASTRVIGLASLPLEQRLPSFLRLSETDASMLTAMLTGDRTYLQRGTRLGFERTGSFHLLVVSGMHLAIFASVVFFVSRRLHLPKLPAIALTLALSFAYALFTGFGEPVQRSFFMVALYLVGQLIFRERFALQALGLAGLALLAADPRALFGSSLQMTLLSVVAIGGIAAPLAERTFVPYLRATRNLWLVALDPSLRPRVAQYRVMLRLLCEHLAPLTGRWIARRAFPRLIVLSLQALELLLLSVIVELVMALPMAIYFHRVTVLSLPVNFLIVPFLGLLLPAAMTTFTVLLLSPSLAVFPAAVAAGLLHLVAGIVNFFATIHAGDYRIPPPPEPRIVAWIVLIAGAVWLVRRARWAPVGACALLSVAAVLTVLPQPVIHRAGSLEVTAIDVGQGDALLVISPDGQTLLVDAGGIAGAPDTSSFNMGEDVVSPVLWSRGIRRLDAVAITHAHTDHIGGMPAVLANFRPHVIWVGNNPASHEYASLTQEASSLGIPLVQHFSGDRWGLGEAGVEALWPTVGYQPKAQPTNNDSLVLRLSYAHRSALLEGDAEAPAEASMVAAGLSHADLLKVGHHGSRSSTIPTFLAAVTPQYAAISVGRKNYYGHPRHEILDELQAAHTRTYRTDMFGATTFYLDRRGVSAEPWAGGDSSQP